MNQDEYSALRPGLSFARKHELTNKEIEVFSAFLDKPMTTFEVAERLKRNPGTINHLIIRLKLRGLIIPQKKNDRNEIIYGLCDKD